MKKIYIIMVSLFVFLFGTNAVEANNYCTKENAMQIAKILYRETGSDTAVNSDENFFMRLSTAAVIINNANTKKGNTFYEKIYNLTDSNYHNYSSYRDKAFEDVVSANKRSEMLYIAEMVLSGKYTFPKNMKLQASKSIVEKYGIVWTYIDSKPGAYDVYFGYEGSSLSNVDIYGNNISDTSVKSYKSRAIELELSNYSDYTVNTVCSGISNNNGTGGSNSGSDNNGGSNNGNGGNTPGNNNVDNNNQVNQDSAAFDTCTNPDVLKVIYFCLLLIDIVKIAIPIGLIVMGMIDFSKSVATSDEGIQKKNISLFIKRVIYAVLVFVVPWIVKILIINLGDLTKDVNYTDCLENANSETIEAIESGNFFTSGSSRQD